jgi:hypothetical protein
LCKMQIAPDLQSDLNVRRAYTFLDIWGTDLGHFPNAMKSNVWRSFIVGLRSRLLSASLPCFPWNVTFALQVFSESLFGTSHKSGLIKDPNVPSLRPPALQTDQWLLQK